MIDGKDIYIYVSGKPQPEAIGHTQTCLQPEPRAGKDVLCAVDRKG